MFENVNNERQKQIYADKNGSLIIRMTHRRMEENINYTLHKTEVKRLSNVLKVELVTPPIRRIMTVFKVINLISGGGRDQVALSQVSGT